MPEQNFLSDLNAWQEIIHSSNWRVFVKLLKDHQDYLQSEGNAYLRKKEYVDAYGCLAKMDDCKKITSLVQNRISEIRKSKGEKG